MIANPVRVTSGLVILALLAACSDQGGDPSKQYGPNPDLPEAHQYLVPPMSVPQAVGWQTGETPTVPAGMRIQAMATGLMHPRIVYPLPNGISSSLKPTVPAPNHSGPRITSRAK